MKAEAPILMKPPLVAQARLGLKTQTRRTGGKQPAADATFLGLDERGRAHFSDGTIWSDRYGGPGTLLWLKENYSFGHAPNDEPDQGIALFRDGDPQTVYHPLLAPERLNWARAFRNRSAIHMYRWAARTFFRETALRVERVQDITEEDAWAEGITGIDRNGYDLGNPHHYIGAKFRFWHLWDQINADRGLGWNVNPWVFVVGFVYEPGPHPPELDRTKQADGLLAPSLFD